MEEMLILGAGCTHKLNFISEAVRADFHNAEEIVLSPDIAIPGSVFVLMECKTDVKSRKFVRWVVLDKEEMRIWKDELTGDADIWIHHVGPRRAPGLFEDLLLHCNDYSGRCLSDSYDNIF
jgi:hypothetical protein